MTRNILSITTALLRATRNYIHAVAVSAHAAYIRARTH